MACAVAGGAVMLVLAPLLLNGVKDMGPSCGSIDRALPPGQPVYALGVDETLRAEFPFYTGRTVMPMPRWQSGPSGSCSRTITTVAPSTWRPTTCS